MEAKLFHADGQTDGRTDMTKLIVPFRNLANAPKCGLKNFSRLEFDVSTKEND